MHSRAYILNLFITGIAFLTVLDTAFSATDDDCHSVTIACIADVTIALGPAGTVTIDPADILAYAISDCMITDTMMSQTTFDCSDIGTHNVITTVYDDCGNFDMCTSLVTVVDISGPGVICHSATLTLDETGNVDVTDYVFEILEFTSENCGDILYYWSPVFFDCSDAGTYQDIDFDIEDVSGNMTSCTVTVYVTGPDTDKDCDSVSDPCDVCAFGDDTVDHNGDGIPDCSQELALADYDPSWVCRSDRIIACKLNGGGVHTKCIKTRQIAEYLANGDHIGPCQLCAEEHAMSSTTPIPSVSQSLQGENSIDVIPNPISPGNAFVIAFDNPNLTPGNIAIFDIAGKAVWSDDYRGQTNYNRISVVLTDALAGIYFVRITSIQGVRTAMFVIQ